MVLQTMMRHCMQMGVDLHRSDVLRINLNMSFPRLPCQSEVHMPYAAFGWPSCVADEMRHVQRLIRITALQPSAWTWRTWPWAFATWQSRHRKRG